MYVIKWLGMYLASKDYVLGTGRDYTPELQNARIFKDIDTAETHRPANDQIVTLASELETPE